MSKYNFQYSLVYSAVTLVALMIGLPLIGIRHWFWIALGIAAASLIPTLGTSICMIIWGFCVLTVNQNIRQGLWLMLLYAIIMILEQILMPFFPRGNLFGATPFEMLLSCAIGYLVTAMQPVGMLIGPIVYLLGKKTVLTFFEPRNTRVKLTGYFNQGFRK